MRSLSIVCLFVLLAFGQSRRISNQIRHLLDDYRRDVDNNSSSGSVNRDNFPPVKILLDFPVWAPTVTPVQAYKIQGDKGYVLLNSIYDANWKSQAIYVNLYGWYSEYATEALLQPADGPGLLNQLRSEGSSGYRIKRRVITREGYYIAYVKDMNRDNQYGYQYLPPPNTGEEWFKQITEQGAQGFKYWGFFNTEGYSSLFIKDWSRPTATYVYAPFVATNSTSEFIQRTNDLGQQGYRFVAFQYIVNYLETVTTSILIYPLYVKDETQQKTYLYKFVPKPAAMTDYINQIKEQAADGYLYFGTTESASSSPEIFNIYLDWRVANDRTLDIDGGF